MGTSTSLLRSCRAKIRDSMPGSKVNGRNSGENFALCTNGEIIQRCSIRISFRHRDSPERARSCHDAIKRDPDENSMPGAFCPRSSSARSRPAKRGAGQKLFVPFHGFQPLCARIDAFMSPDGTGVALLCLDSPPEILALPYTRPNPPAPSFRSGGCIRISQSCMDGMGIASRPLGVQASTPLCKIMSNTA